MKRFIFTIILIFIITPNLFATTNFVSLTGNHIPPFSTWADAATNIQDAVDVAVSNDVVLVNDGTYYLTDQISITKSIIVKSVNGADKTIVDGGFPVQTNRCFYIKNGATIDSFTIKSGAIDGGRWERSEFNSGGGIYCDLGCELKNCIITENFSNYDGGGIYCNRGTIISNIIINNNATEAGGGIYLLDGGLQNCSVISNLSNLGGGICSVSGMIYNCIINYNHAIGGGGIYMDYGSIQNSLINYNNSEGSGGGIDCFAGFVNKCSITENLADDGGGISFWWHSSFAQNCTITKNSANRYGGGVECNGAIIQNSLITENLATEGGGALSVGYDSFVINCTICKNTCSKSKTDGVWIRPERNNIYNTIIYGHKGEGLWFNSGFENRANRIKTLKNYTKNCWFGRPPGFIDIENNDFRLSRKSPCINRGSTNYSKLNIAFPETDLAGNSRVMNGRIDIGAYEYNRDIFTKYKIKWNKANKDKIIFKSKFKDYKNLGENLSVKVGNSFIVSNLEPFKVTTKVAKYKSDNPKCLATLKVKPDGILAKIKCLKLNKLDNVLNITNETGTDLWRDLDVEYFLGTNLFADKISTRYRSKKDKFCKGQKP